jgi:hypothetical protein
LTLWLSNAWRDFCLTFLPCIDRHVTCLQQKFWPRGYLIDGAMTFLLRLGAKNRVFERLCLQCKVSSRIENWSRYTIRWGHQLCQVWQHQLYRFMR